VQSFDPADPTTDADLLADASGAAPDEVCRSHRWYEVAMAPPMAADVLGRPTVRLADLVDELSWPDGTDLVLLETAGGVRSPIAHDGDTCDLVRELARRGSGPDEIVLVAHAGLGTLNDVLLSVDALLPSGRPITVFLNRFDASLELQRRNREWLADRHELSVVTAVDELCRRLAMLSGRHA
jgi:dethiobiotin synthetase